MERPVTGVARPPARLGLAVFATCFAIYAWTSSPALGWHDSPEFVAASVGMGVAHSPGHPIPVFLGRVCAVLPIGDLAWRVHLASALVAALATLVLSLAARALVVRAAPDLGRSAGVMAAAVATCVALSWAAWSNATRAEVYAFQHLATAGILGGLVLYDHHRHIRWLAVAGLFAGFGLANHHFMALTVILPAAVIVLGARALRPSCRAVAVTAVVGAVGLAALLYLPVRSQRHPEVNFAAPHQASRFAWTLSGAAFARSVAEEHASSAGTDAAQVVGAAIESLSAPLFLLALVGAVIGLRSASRWRRLAAILAGVALLSGAARVMLGFDPETPDHHAYLLPAITALALLALGGLASICAALASARRPQPLAGPVVAGALCVLLPVQLVTHAERSALTEAWVSQDVADWELDGLPPRALLLPAYFETSFRLWAMRAVQDARPDLGLLDRSFLTFPGAAAEARLHDPELAAVIDAPLRAGRVTPVAELTAVTASRPVYFQLHPNLDPAARRHLVPAGAFARFQPQSPSAVAGQALVAADRQAGSELARVVAGAGIAELDHALRAQLWHDVTRLEQYCALGMRGEAQRVLQDALALAPRDTTLPILARQCGLSGLSPP